MAYTLPMTPSSEPEAPRYSIGVVARRTGLKPDLIRAWERRYGAVEPARSETRRRRYSDAEVRRLRLLRQAVDGGHSIGDIAHLPDAEIEELIAADAAAAATVGGAARGRAVPAAPWGGDQPEAVEAMLDACLAAVRALDARALDRELDRASLALSRAHLLEQLLVPLMERVGDLWHEGELRPFHEHLATSIVRSFLGGLTPSSGQDGPRGGAPAIVLTTPARQRHELGALIAAVTAASAGWTILYLGPDLPAEEIAGVALESGARAVALSLTYPPDDPSLAGEMARLRRLLPQDVELVVGGRAAAGYAGAVEAAGGRRLEDLSAFRRVLGELRSDGVIVGADSRHNR